MTASTDKREINRTALKLFAAVLVWFLVFFAAFTAISYAAPQDNKGTAAADGPAKKDTDLIEPAKSGNGQGKAGVSGTTAVNGSPLDGTKPKLPDTISFFQTLVALSFVLGLIFLSAYFFKKLTGMKTGNMRASRVSITPVGNLALGEKKFLSVVEIQGKFYFIGITPNNISMLSELDLELQDEPGDTGQSDFAGIFRKARTLLQHGGGSRPPGQKV